MNEFKSIEKFMNWKNMLIDIHLRDDILKYFPNFEYFSCNDPSRLDFSKCDNLTGMQQEAFLNYWIIKQMKDTLDHGFSNICGLDIGCGQNIHINCIGIDFYYGQHHPVYGGEYKPNVTFQAENLDKIFNNDTFSFIVASHILEHVDEPMLTFRKWCKLLRKDGIMIILLPDYTYEKSVESWDITHKTFWTPDDFEKNCIIPNQDIMKCEEFNTLKNKFSMNFIGRRI